MTNSEVHAAISTLAQKELGLDGPMPGGDLGEHLDSMQRLTLVVAIEDRFEICFEPEDEVEIRTMDDVIRLVQAKRAE